MYWKTVLLTYLLIGTSATLVNVPLILKSYFSQKSSVQKSIDTTEKQGY